jgi:outer membrane protein assembly factor BamB
LHCIEAATGKELYVEKVGPRDIMPISQFASPFVTADGLVYFASSGRSMVIKAGPKFEKVAVNDLGDGGRNNGYNLNSAAVSDGKIFILGQRKLWCIGSR